MRSRALALISVAALLSGASGAAAAAPEDDLGARLDAALSARALRGARIAALVVDRDARTTLFARNPDRSLVPASNLKLLTAAAALSALGPTHRFVTQLLSDAAPDGEGAIDSLYVRGGGDPALTSEDFWRLAADLGRRGVRRVRGDLVLDDSAFDGERWHPSWGSVSARAYHAPIGALTANYGAFTVTLEPGVVVGEAVRADVDPHVAFLQLTNRARTGSARARYSLQVDRRGDRRFEQVLVSGVAPAGGEVKTYRRGVLDPARYAGAVLRMQLAAVGIQVDGETRLGYAPESAVELLAFSGHSLAEVVRRFLKHSNNSIGEALVKSLGARASGGPGTWRGGLQAVRAELAALGLPLEHLRLVDGSGLSYDNRVTPRLLVEALRRGAGSFSFGPEFVAALPIAAADGTLEERVEQASGRVRAKTGLLTRVTGLSGIAERADGSVAYFSVLVNGFRGSAEDAMDAVDDFLEALVGDQELLAVSPSLSP
jgi:D-alanyl-D-alanine carboxypeptidase/D-alanyl-D-alanine-endopeptidase (penicillin-binding protein 4)